MSSYRLNIYAFYGVSLAVMAYSFYALYYTTKANDEQTERTMVVVSIVGAIMSLVGLIMAIHLDKLDQRHLLVPMYTYAFDDLPKPKPMMTGLDTAEP